MNLEAVKEQLDLAWDAIQLAPYGGGATALERLHCAMSKLLIEVAWLEQNVTALQDERGKE